jgi:hypothetical protein
MISQNDIDKLVDYFVQEERSIPPNPFLATRIIGSISKGGTGLKRLVPAWQGVLMAVSLVLVTSLGIKLGSLYKPAGSSPNQKTVMFVNDETLEHFAFYQQTPKE